MKNQLSPQEIKAMVQLLDDTDEEVYRSIETHLLEIGKEVIPLLEDTWSNSLDAALQSRIEELVHKIQFESLKKELQTWNNFHRHDLFSGVILIARYQYPDLDEDKVRNFFNQLRRDVWIELNDGFTALEQIRIMNRVLFDQHGFSGNTANFHAPQNSFINNVIESKKGNPIMLSVIYTLLAQELDIPIYGVNLPEHFILCYQHLLQSPDYTYTYPDANVLFYINAFSKGSVFSKDEIETYLKKINLTPHKSYFEPCANEEIIKRILRNLSFSFNKSGYADKVEEIDALLNVMEEEQ